MMITTNLIIIISISALTYWISADTSGACVCNSQWIDNLLFSTLGQYWPANNNEYLIQVYQYHHLNLSWIFHVISCIMMNFGGIGNCALKKTDKFYYFNHCKRKMYRFSIEKSLIQNVDRAINSIKGGSKPFRFLGKPYLRKKNL